MRVGAMPPKSIELWGEVHNQSRVTLSTTAICPGFQESRSSPLTLACLAESGLSIKHIDFPLSLYNYSESGQWSGLTEEEQAERNLIISAEIRGHFSAGHRMLSAIGRLWRRLETQKAFLQRLTQVANPK